MMGMLGMHEDEKKVIATMVRLVERDVRKASKNLSFLKNLLIQIEIYYGLYLTGDISEKSKQAKDVQNIMTFIAYQKQTSVEALMKMFMMEMNEQGLGDILGGLELSEFIYPIVKEGNEYIIRYRKKEVRNDTIRDT